MVNNKFLQLASNLPAGTSMVSDAIDVTDYKGGCFEFILANADHNDATVKIEECNVDGAWSDYAAATALSANGSYKIKMNSMFTRWIRFNYTKASNTTGAFSASLTLKN